jgi:hypothetical protein
MNIAVPLKQPPKWGLVFIQSAGGVEIIATILAKVLSRKKVAVGVSPKRMFRY